MNRGGRFVTIGYASGTIPSIALNLVLLKGLTILGFEARTFGRFFPELLSRDRGELSELLATGRLNPYVGARYSLNDTSGALRNLETRQAIGKVIIEIGEDG
jgi:NADPH:quinone reductase-like Zn-dependent oxidoreductase